MENNIFYSLNQFLNILLIINYNHKNYEKLNFYILNLYKNFFPNYRKLIKIYHHHFSYGKYLNIKTYK